MFEKLIEVLIPKCKNCGVRWTKHCPLRVFGRHEGNRCNALDNDYCSSFVKGKNGYYDV